MTALRIALWATAIAPLGAVGDEVISPDARQLVLNPDFTVAAETDLPAHWSVWSPSWAEAACALRSSPEGLQVDAPGRPFAVGGLWQDLPGVEPGKAYAIEVFCDIKNIRSPLQSVCVRWTWTREEKSLHPAGSLLSGPFPASPDSKRPLASFRDTFVAPETADGARLSLEVKWPQGGSVRWVRADVHPSSPPPPRKVKIGTVYLPREEWKKGITPGSEYPVFKTDFGTVAIQICYDWFFPEAHTAFRLWGAEIVFAPTWGNTLPDDDGCVRGETVFRVRARDNGVYLVPSVYDGNSMVIDPMGRILATSDGGEGVFWAEVDLNRRESLPWVGHWRSIGPRHRMPATYNPLVDSRAERQD